MPKYRVTLRAIARTTIEVEADDKDDAYDKTLDKPMPRICAACSGWGGGQNLELGEFDLGQDIGVEEAVEEMDA